MLAPSTTKLVKWVNQVPAYVMRTYLIVVLRYDLFSLGHYVENIGKTIFKLIEIFDLNICEDISLNQWLAPTSPKMVRVRGLLAFSG